MSKAPKKHSAKKTAAALLLAIAILASAFGGTLAWRDYRQHKTNEASNKMPMYDVTLVENFREKDDWKTSDGELTKQISVKNTGLTDGTFEEVYTRIQLKEYMDFTPMLIEQTDEYYMVDANGAFIVFGSEADAQASYPGHEVTQLSDAITGITKWFVQTQEHDDNGQYGKQVVTKYQPGTKEFLVGDASMEAAREDARKDRKHNEKPNAECAYPIHTWETVDLTNVLAQPNAADYIRWFLGTEVVLYSEWDGSYGPFWIIDDRADAGDSWIYWGEALFPGKETAKFLEAIALIQQPQGDFYYAIHTEMEALSLDELFGDNAQWGNMPEDIRQGYKYNAPQVILYEGAAEDGVLAQASYTIEQGEELTLDAAVKPDTADQNIEWTVTPDNGTVSYVYTNGALVITGLEPGVVTVKATSVATGKFATLNVTVTGSAPMGIPTPVNDFTMFYSEGNMTYGAAAEAETTTTATNLTIDLASPIGAVTNRYFTLSSAQTATINDGGTGATFTEASGTDKVLSIPENAAGTITLTIGGYTVTVNVDSGRGPNSSVKKGETFAASGIEWRVLGKTGTQALVIAEHMLFIELMDATSSKWASGNGWGQSVLCEYLDPFWASTLDAGFTDTILLTTIHTRMGYSGNTYNALNDQKVFLLSEEEVYNTVDEGTPDLSKNLLPGEVLFPDNNSRKATALLSFELYDGWWLRSYKDSLTKAAFVDSLTGLVSSDLANNGRGVRPAMMVDLGA
jgi:hypothetical protein